MMRILTLLILFIVMLLLTVLSSGTATEPTPAVRVSSSQDLLVLPEVTIAVPFDQIQYDTGLFDTHQPTRLTATRNCLYLIVGQLTWSPTYGGRTFLYIRKNGLTRIGVVEGLEDQSISVLHPLFEGEYVELYAYINGEASMWVKSLADHSPVFSMVCLNEI
jgi:hypothetical protein